MFNQVKQSLIASDDVPGKLGKNIDLQDLSQPNGIKYLVQQPSASANNSWIKKKGWRLAGIRELLESFCLLEKVKTLTLTMEEIINLEKNTQYKEDEIKEWFRSRFSWYHTVLIV